jgi:hypothetical protein
MIILVVVMVVIIDKSKIRISREIKIFGEAPPQCRFVHNKSRVT